MNRNESMRHTRHKNTNDPHPWDGQKLRKFLNKAMGIINFAKPLLNFIDDTMI